MGIKEFPIRAFVEVLMWVLKWVIGGVGLDSLTKLWTDHNGGGDPGPPPPPD